MIREPINETLPATGETPVLIKLPSARRNCRDWIIQARGDVDMKISNTSGMTKVWTVKSGRADSIGQTLGKNAEVCYAVSGSTEDVVEVLAV
jgi:hypothetical protein